MQIGRARVVLLIEWAISLSSSEYFIIAIQVTHFKYAFPSHTYLHLSSRIPFGMKSINTDN